MVDIVNFEPWHVDAMTPQPWQTSEHSHRGDYGYAKTAMLGDVPLACAGVLELWPGRGHAWALLSVDSGPHLLAITRAIKDHFTWLPFQRVEMHVLEGFDQAARWAQMLGFTCETPNPMPKFHPDGRGAFLYSRVR